jgi:hypothetical protein
LDDEDTLDSVIEIGQLAKTSWASMCETSCEELEYIDPLEVDSVSSNGTEHGATMIGMTPLIVTKVSFQ